ncbi:MAG: hypothetical protein AAF063_12935 [Cyanobacteria bacterium J06643_5]
MNSNFNTKIIDPQKANLPKNVVIQKVHSETERLPELEHSKAVRAFYSSDSIASGIGKDLAFVDKIPQLINEIIENKSWECLYVTKGVTTPYYCRYVKGTESENFRAFITAKRPNGLETSVETLDRVLQANLEVQRKFREIIYQAAEPHRDASGKYKSIPSHSDYGSVKSAQQERIRAANRAAEAIREIGNLLDRGLIAIDIAAKLGRDIKDPENLTAEEREYVDKRDLIGIRIRQYIYTNPIPSDEDKEPAYSRELNRFVKDLLGIKDRSKSIRMDHPKKAAQKLLQFYEGEKLSELIDLLKQGLEPLTKQSEARDDFEYSSRSSQTNDCTEIPIQAQTASQRINIDYLAQTEQNFDTGNEYKAVIKKNISEYTTSPESKDTDYSIETLGFVDANTDNGFYKMHHEDNTHNTDNNSEQIKHVDNAETSFDGKENTVLNYSRLQEELNGIHDDENDEVKDNTEVGLSLHVSPEMKYTLNELAERLERNPETVKNMSYKDRFAIWSQKLDRDGIAWQRYGTGKRRKGEPLLFIPFTPTILDESNQQENSDVIENGI